VILGGDVGGTKCNLALFTEQGGRLTPVFQKRYPSKSYAEFNLLVADFLREAATTRTGDGIAAAGFGVAGPVVQDKVQATNLPWIVDAKRLATQFHIPRVVLMNDLAATASSIAHLPLQDLLVLNPGKPEPGGTRALIAAGTGLGEGFLVWDGMRYRVSPSEGGHADFAPHTEQQIELLRFMRRRNPQQVSWEMILSGRGFRTLHEFVAPAVRHASFDDPDADPAPEITRRGLEKSCPTCAETLELWTAIYGSEAGNLALKVLALGGVYIAGGIAHKIIEKIKDGTFLRNFVDKWKFETLLSNIPVCVVMNESAPLLGAAQEALAAKRPGQAQASAS
jgi:glucokinase